MKEKKLGTASQGIWSDKAINLNSNIEFVASFYSALRWCLEKGGKLIIYREDDGQIWTSSIGDEKLESKPKLLYISEHIEKVERNEKNKVDKVIENEIANKIIFDMRKKSNIYIKEWYLSNKDNSSTYDYGPDYGAIIFTIIVMIILLFLGLQLVFYGMKEHMKETILWILS